MLSSNLMDNLTLIKEKMHLDASFDLVYRTIKIADHSACFIFVDGFCKDELLEKILQYFLDIKAEEFPQNAYLFLKEKMPYVEVDHSNQEDVIITNILSGVFALFIDTYSEAILIDTRTYPARGIAEPERDKSLRGSKDCFVETLIFNCSLIRRRIRSPQLIVKMFTVGKISKTDVSLIYLSDRVDTHLLSNIEDKIQNLNCEALSMNQETLAEALVHTPWFNPFPKVRYSERPDTTCAQILEGNLVILVDNSPYACILPATVYDLVEEVDDYYFPPITGSYLRITRFLITIFSYTIAPFFLYATQHPEILPENLTFLLLKEPANIPVFWQFLIMELAIDGLRLASVNTPTMLSTPLSILAALVLGEFSVSSGFFSREVMLIMAFIAVSSYTLPSFELGYAIKFMRLISLVLTAIFGWIGILLGHLVLLAALCFNKTIGGKSYISPLKPYRPFKGIRHLIRRQKKQ